MKREYQSLTNRQLEDFIMEHIRRSNVKRGKLLDYDQILEGYRDSYASCVSTSKQDHEKPITFLQFMYLEKEDVLTKWDEEDRYEEYFEEFGEEFIKKEEWF
jgi:hypothetical protein